MSGNLSIKPDRWLLDSDCAALAALRTPRSPYRQRRLFIEFGRHLPRPAPRLAGRPEAVLIDDPIDVQMTDAERITLQDSPISLLNRSAQSVQKAAELPPDSSTLYKLTIK